MLVSDPQLHSHVLIPFLSPAWCHAAGSHDISNLSAQLWSPQNKSPHLTLGIILIWLWEHFYQFLPLFWPKLSRIQAVASVFVSMSVSVSCLPVPLPPWRHIFPGSSCYLHLAPRPSLSSAMQFCKRDACHLMRFLKVRLPHVPAHVYACRHMHTYNPYKYRIWKHAWLLPAYYQESFAY